VTRDADVVPASERAQYAALFDPVTRLPGWALLVDRVNVALLRSQRLNRQVAVLVLRDIKASAGTSLALGDLAAKLHAALRPDDTIAQIGDRTLVAVCNDLSDDEQARRIAGRLLETSDVVCHLRITLSGRDHDAEVVLARALSR
jgi:GGDEF domain-containing protein